MNNSERERFWNTLCSLDGIDAIEDSKKLQETIVYPKNIYRYRPVSVRTLEALKNNKLYFSTSNYYDDPFDTFINVRIKDIRPNLTGIQNDEAASREYITQMWAEIMTLYNSGKIRLKLPAEIEKNLIEYQRPFMQEDTWTGLIQEWLDNYSGDIVCVQQIYNEALKEFGKPRNSEAREIGLIMNSTISGWNAYPNPRNIPGYGKQRGWIRVETKLKHSFQWKECSWRFPFDA